MKLLLIFLAIFIPVSSKSEIIFDNNNNNDTTGKVVFLDSEINKINIEFKDNDAKLIKNKIKIKKNDTKHQNVNLNEFGVESISLGTKHVIKFDPSKKLKFVEYYNNKNTNDNKFIIYKEKKYKRVLNLLLIEYYCYFLLIILFISFIMNKAILLPTKLKK